MDNLVKKRIKKYIIIGLGILLLYGVFIFVNSGLISFDDFVKVKLDTSTGMNTKQRIKDFNNLCKNLENQVPMLYEYEKLYGIKYEKIKSLYKEKISACKNDYEYYAYIDGFLNNIPSYHISLQFPNLSYMTLVHKYIISENYTVPPAVKYWDNVLHDECKKHYDEKIPTTIFMYFAGKYIGHTEADDDKDSITNSQLISINGIKVNEFIKTFSSTQKLKYDHVNNNPYREYICFNDLFGEKCLVEFKDKKGKIHTKQMYCGTTADEVITYINYYKALDNGTLGKVNERKDEYPHIDEVDYSESYLEMESAIMVRDKQRNLVYILIKNFYGTTWCVAEMIKHSKNEDNIIIDLRGNSGGFKQVCDGIISELTTSDIEVNDTLYFSNKISDNLKYSGLFENANFINKHNGLYSYSTKTVIPGNATKEKNIIVLVNSDTGSAADRFTMIIKKYNIGIVIGSNNTAGECYGSPYFGVLRESGLIFYYPFNKYLNADGTDNSVYGTSPNIYINYDMSNYRTRDNLVNNGINLNTYENRLLYDDELIKALEIIKEKENAE